MEDLKSEVVMKAPFIEEDAKELEEVTYRHAKDVIKPGDKYDLLVLFCAMFAAVCFTIMILSGIREGFTKTMIALLVCYLIIIFVTLYRPLHIILSKFIWSKKFRKSFLVNQGFSEEIKLTEEGIIYSDNLNMAHGFKFSEMQEVFESDNYMIFMMDDNNIYAVKNTEITSDALKEHIISLITSDIPKEQDEQ